MSVKSVLKSAHRPLTTEEIVTRVKDKNRNSVFSEIRNLKKHKLIIKLEIKASIDILELGKPIVLFKWIGD